MLNRVLFALALALSAAFALPLIEDRVFGGEVATPGQFPHQISLRLNRNNTYRHICGGSIISEYFVLTAAHCYPRLYPNVSDYRVVVGAHENNGDDGQAYDVIRFIIHESWNSTLLIHDVGLIEVNTTIDFSERVRAIPLHRSFIGGAVEAVTSGWGRTNDNVTSLKFARVNTMSNNECRERLEGQQSFIHDFSTLCVYSGINGTGVCSGDSGGPLIFENQLIGVTSWAYLCARGLPDGFARVSEYVDWIEENMLPEIWD